jgi:hypothetical protein
MRLDRDFAARTEHSPAKGKEILTMLGVIVPGENPGWCGNRKLRFILIVDRTNVQRHYSDIRATMASTEIARFWEVIS